MLHGRGPECELLDRMLQDGRSGRSGVLVLRGEPGIGKTALLREAAARADGYRVLQAMGVQSEAEYPFAGMHQLLLPVLERRHLLPGPQAAALAGAFGLEQIAVDNRFLVSLAVLGLLAEVAEDGPVLCVVDDAHWLDQASADALSFVARRLDAEGVVLLVAARAGTTTFPAQGLPEHQLGGLDPAAAEQVMLDAVPGLSGHAGQVLLEASAGNPLGLRELARSLTPAQAAGLDPLPDPLPVTSGLENLFLGQLRMVSAEVRLALLVAATAHGGDTAVIRRAIEQLGLPAGTLDTAETAELLRSENGVSAFEHPLMRSTVYQAATYGQRQAVHLALAEVLDKDGEHDGQAWHLAAAATGPDEQAAAALHAAAERSSGRGGHASAAAALHRAAVLSSDPALRAGRFAAAGTAAWRAGQPHRARELLSHADDGAPDAVSAARVAQLRGVLEFKCGSTRDAVTLLETGASLAREADPALARRILVDAAQVAWTDGNLNGLRRSAAALRDLAGVDPLADGIEGIEAYVTDDFTRAAAKFRSVRDALTRPSTGAGAGPPDPQMALVAAAARGLTGDDAGYAAELEGAVSAARSAGAVEDVPGIVILLASADLERGRFAAARAGGEEALRLSTDTRQEILVARACSVLAWAAAVEGRVEDCAGLRQRAIAPLSVGPPWPPAVVFADWAWAVLELARGRPEAAFEVLEPLAEPVSGLGYQTARLRSAGDLVEAAIRTGRPDPARAATDRLAAWAQATEAPPGLALLDRCRALLAENDEAAACFESALNRYRGVDRPFDAARTSLLYGEWLRRRRRRTDARTHLRRACSEFERLGAATWAERARAELRATGETARKRDPSTLTDLTPQEFQIARSVAAGATNREVAAQLFLSPRTVDYHLAKVFAKLGIASRRELIMLGDRLAEH